MTISRRNGLMWVDALMQGASPALQHPPPWCSACHAVGASSVVQGHLNAQHALISPLTSTGSPASAQLATAVWMGPVVASHVRSALQERMRAPQAPPHV